MLSVMKTNFKMENALPLSLQSRFFSCVVAGIGIDRISAFVSADAKLNHYLGL